MLTFSIWKITEAKHVFIFASHSTETGLFLFFVTFASLAQRAEKASHVMQTVNKVFVGLLQGQTVLSQLAFVVVVR